MYELCIYEENINDFLSARLFLVLAFIWLGNELDTNPIWRKYNV